MEEKRTPKGPIIAIVVVVLAAAGLIVFALSSQQDVTPPNEATQSNATNDTNDTAQTTDEAAPTPSERMLITYKDGGFEPADITVKKGTVITVKNESSNNVQFSSADHPTHRINPEMNMKSLAPGESGTYTATKVGTWGYHDHVDASMTGTVTVTE